MGRLDRCLYVSHGPCTVQAYIILILPMLLYSYILPNPFGFWGTRSQYPLVMAPTLPSTRADVSVRSMLPSASSGICRRRTTRPRTLEGRTAGPCVSSRSKTTPTTKVSRMHSLCDSPRSIHPCPLFFLRVVCSLSSPWSSLGPPLRPLVRYCCLSS